MAEHHPSTSVLIFQDAEFDIVDIHNIPWLRGYQVGSALGYSDATAAIAKIYDRNADEFTEAMTQLVELDTAGGRQQVRIFSPRGCYLLGMLARTAKAKAFRHWVLDVLEGRLVPFEAKPMTVYQRLSANRLRMALIRELKWSGEPGVRRAIHAQLAQVSGLLSLATPALGDIGKDEPQIALPGV